MHEFYDKLSVADFAGLMFDTEEGLKCIREELHKTEAGNYYDTFIEETCNLLCYLFINGVGNTENKNK